MGPWEELGLEAQELSEGSRWGWWGEVGAGDAQLGVGEI